MIRLRSILVRLRNYWSSARDERDFSDELESHLALHVDDGMRSGLEPAEARRQALLKLGGLESTRERHRDRRGFPPLDHALQDLRHALRSLRRSLAFALVAIATLGLSIGATASLFSIIDATLIAPLHTPDAEKLVWIDEFAARGTPSGGTPQRLADWQKLHSFENAAGFYSEGLVLVNGGNPRRVDALRTFGPLGSVLHAPLTLGRMPAEREASGDEPAVILTHAFWKSAFNGDTSILGRAIVLGGKAYPVIGVLSDAVRYPEGVDVWIPATHELQAVSRVAGFLGQVARLKPNVNLPAAQAELDVESAILAEQHPATDRGRRARIVSLHEHVTFESRASLFTLFGAVGSVFLVACFNVAGLLLARGMSRRREGAIRMALGAGRVRLIRFFVMEGVVLSIAGGACGIALAVSGIEFLKHFLPAEIPRLDTALLDVRTLAFTGIAICVSALLCGVIPAVQLASRVQVGSLNEGARSIGGPREGLRGILVVAEVAVSVVLLVAAGLLAGSYLHMRHVPLGFQPDRAVSFTVAFPWETPSANLNSFAAQALDRIGKIPGVESAGIVDRLPLHGETQSGPVLVRGQALSPSLALRSISWRTATPDYFVSAGIPIAAGAVFSADQGPSGARMALINQRLAALLFRDVNPIGQEISRKEGAAAPSWFRIAGVVSDVRQNPSDAEAQPEVYVPWGSTYWPVMNFVIRTVRPGPAIAREIRAAVQPLTMQQVIGSVAPLQDATDETEEAPRNRAWLLSCFAGAATLLAGVGIFGLLSQEVVRRTPEFGVRLALGAAPRRLFWSTTLRGMRLVMAGLVTGVVLSVAATRAVQSLLPPGDAFASSSYALAGAVILLATFLASLLPGLRAAGIDPLTALRGD